MRDGTAPHSAAVSGRPRSALPPRTFAGFVAAIVALLIIAFLSYRSFEDRAASARRMAQTLAAIQQLEALLSVLKDAETGQRGFLLTADEPYLEPYEAALRELPSAIARARSSVIEEAEQTRRLDVLQRLAQEKVDELKRTVELMRSGQRAAALDLVRAHQGRRAMDEIRGVVAEMKAAEEDALRVRSAEWEKLTVFSLWGTWTGTALLLLLIIAAGVMSTRDFREQRTQVWLRARQNELALQMQGELDTRTLGDNVARSLAVYLEAQVGVVYAEVDDRLTVVGTYALSREAVEAKDTTSGAAGLARQVLREGRVIHVADVPEDYFAISSGLGHRRPRHLLIAPTLSDGVPNGVVELGFFRPLEPEDLELVRLVGDSIGVALRSARYRAERQKLLEETQRQAEELQTQQEELRVANEELEQQTRVQQQSQERLKNQQTELEQINSQLEEHTLSLERQRDELARAQAELQRASTYKSEFLANMSHELRTPLNSSLILAKLLADNRDGNLTGEQIKFAQTIYSAGNDLLVLINDILDLSRIEAGKLEVQPEDISVSRVVDDLSNTFQPIAADKGLRFEIRIDAEASPHIYTDSVRLQQILRNLLSNAFKFTERGTIELSVTQRHDGRLCFAVKDSGIGIPFDQQRVIFEAFRQADGTSNRKYGGTGLGLSISRDLARLLGGDLSVESARGQGSTFTLLLPARYEPTDPKASRPASARAPRATPPPPAGARPRSEPPPLPDDRDDTKAGARSILIVEDDLSFAHIVRDLARELDFKALLAHTGEQGLAMAARYRPSAIILDLGLPDRSGLSVLDALKHDANTRHIPVHVISASDYTQVALEMGAIAYAIKPIKREELVDALRRLETKLSQGVRRVLVVEDDAVLRESTCRLLAADDVETVAVGTAAEALNRLAASTFDCVVLDLSLPDKSGLELLAEMSDRTDHPFPPVIVYTGRLLSKDEEQRLRRFSSSIIIKGARSPERLLDEVTLFLHQVESDLPPDRQRMLRDARHREATFEGRRVLIVEDDVRNIFALTSVLEPRGAKVEIARNGKEALAHLRDNPGVDLVLMDIMMPEMDGLEATREIRKRPELAKLPVIALTAKAMADDRETCIAAGVSDYIAKPLDVDKLLSLARVWMPK